jgi:outer membrane protein assembly factor BamB
LFAGSCAGAFFALDARTGEPLWTYDIRRDGRARNFYGRVHLSEKLLAVPAHGKGAHIYAFEPSAGTVRWKHATAAGSATDVVSDAEAFYVVTLRDELLRLERERGVLSWSYSAGPVPSEARSMGSTPAVGGGRVFFGGVNGTLHALDAQAGALLWKRDFGVEITTSVLLLGDSLVLGLVDGTLLRVSAANGEVQAKTQVQPYPGGALVPAAGRIVVMLAPSSSDSELAAFDETLHLTWRVTAPQGYWTTARPVVQGDHVLAGSSNGLLCAYELQSGELAWSHPVDADHDWELDNVRVIGVDASRVFVGTIGGTLYAFEAGR